VQGFGWIRFVRGIAVTGSKPARAGLLVLLGVLVCAVVAGLFLWQPVWLFHWRDFRTGNDIISRVERHRASHGHLPETLKDIGFTDADSKVFYQKLGDNHYRVWFGTSLGESETYDSQAKKWE
jgi:hypothetical protein